jgi:hypothetical protein
MRGNIVAFVVGLVFALGLGIAGMMMPAKVMGFLDITGDWDLSLALVMVGAIAVHTVFYRMVRGRLSPLLGGKFQIPTRTDLDARLLVGSAMFGTGWGLAGFCPGPALASVGGGSGVVLLFGGSMVCGMHKQRRQPQRRASPQRPFSPRRCRRRRAVNPRIEQIKAVVCWVCARICDTIFAVPQRPLLNQ